MGSHCGVSAATTSELRWPWLLLLRLPDHLLTATRPAGTPRTPLQLLRLRHGHLRVSKLGLGTALQLTKRERVHLLQVGRFVSAAGRSHQRFAKDHVAWRAQGPCPLPVLAQCARILIKPRRSSLKSKLIITIHRKAHWTTRHS